MSDMAQWHADMLSGRMSIVAFERRRLFGLKEAERLEAEDRRKRQQKKAPAPS